MVDVRATGLSGEDFAWKLLADYDVATMPGESFGAAAGGHIRLSLTADDEDIVKGCERIITMAEEVLSTKY